MSIKLERERSENVFEDFKEPYTAGQAAIEANRCLFCSDAPCIKACPTSIDIPQFIRKIATDNVKGSAKTIFDANILGMSCARVCPVEVLCVGDCVYNHMGVPPIQIGKLQRFATDTAFEKGWRFAQAGAPTGKKVALVGGGPASLACAHELRKLGHACTIFEKNPYYGGLNTNGVAPYKMRADKSVEEVEWVLAIGGIELKTGVAVGRDVKLEQLEKEYDAVFIGLGLGADSRLGVPGEEMNGVIGAVDWIEKMKVGRVDVRGVKSAAVVGGGNTAIDCVRELLGLGVPVVTMIYRGDEKGMSGYEHEWEAARTETARAAWRRQPIEFLGDGGRVAKVRCIELDEKKKPIAGSEHAIDAELVLVAIGQAKLGEILGGMSGIELDRGRVVVDQHGCTGRKKFFAGGDCANGGTEVVNAAAEGKRAARAIDRFVKGENHA
jgi:glutamate synthase (NADPH/NADH) small chain